MKKYLIIAFLGLLLLPSCFEDKGNYDYREINETTIGELDELYTVSADIGVLDITPDIEMTLADPDDSRFEYLWIASFNNYSDNAIIDTIGRERVLNWQADLPVNTYDLQFKVIDTQTGIIEKIQTKLNITIYHGKGIMLASEDPEGYFKGQMLVMLPGEETVLYEDLLQNSGLPQLKGAIDFFHTGNTNPENSRAIWIVTESGTYFVNRLSLKMENGFNTFGDKMYFPPESPLNPIDIVPRINSYDGNTGGYSNSIRNTLCSNGDVYHSWMSMQGDVYDLPHSVVDGKNFRAKAPMFYAHKNMEFNNIICYDADGERFLKIGLAAANFDKLADNAGDPFPWNQSGRTMVYGENTLSGSDNGDSFAIMKDDTDQPDYDYCIYKFYASGPQKRAFYTVDRAAAPLFGSATQYAFSSKRTVVFYVVDGKLYAYDYDPSVKRNYQITLADSNPVTMVKFDVQREPGSDFLYVATYNDSTGGTLYKYEIDPDLNTVKLKSEPAEKWTGLAKVKNMSWRGSE